MVKVRPRGAFIQYDIRFTWPDGTEFRERKNAPVTGRAAALRWAQERERAIIAAGKAAHERQTGLDNRTPTLATFWPSVERDWYLAQKKKPSTVATARILYRVHLEPALGAKPLDQITTADVAALKGALSAASPKTVNNVLSVLSRTLRCALEWDVIPGPLPRFGQLRVPPVAMDWYEVETYRRVVDAARLYGHRPLVLVLLAGSAGLRRGEIIALKWTDVDLPRRQITIARGIWGGHETTTKGGRTRIVPMTGELHAALSAHRHLQGERVVYGDMTDSKGRPLELSNRTIRNWMAGVQRRAGVEANGGIHILRHTFCSHLAVAGVSAKAIQELAGHADLATTMRYMHLSPANRSEAMAALGALYAGSGQGKERAG